MRVLTLEEMLLVGGGKSKPKGHGGKAGKGGKGGKGGKAGKGSGKGKGSSGKGCK